MGVFQGQQGGEQRDAPDERLGPVYRIDEPGPARVATGLPEFLADDRVPWVALREFTPEQVLGCPVGLGHRASVPFDHHLDGRPVPLQGEMPGPPGQIAGLLE